MESLARFPSNGLVLVPTPIQEMGRLHPEAFELLNSALANPSDIFLVEELKECRRRWLAWGLPRAGIERFRLFNEHTSKGEEDELIKLMKEGARCLLQSDCGTPAFCDPGQQLVRRCHQQGIPVASTALDNSVFLALILSGFENRNFWFEGFLPQKNPEREQALGRVLKMKSTAVLMDTPYRLATLLEELSNAKCQRALFLAMNLGEADQDLRLVLPDQIPGMAAWARDNKIKQRFILAVEAVNSRP